MDQSFPQPKIQSDGEPYILPTHSKLILMVEDDDNLAKVYLMRFKAEGFDVKRVNNGEDALAAATQYIQIF